MKIFYSLEFFTIMEHFKLPLPQYLLTTPLPNRISSIFCRTRVEVIECYHSNYVVCVAVILLGIVLTIIILYDKCNLLLVVCRSWNLNIDAGLCFTNVLM